MSKPFSIRVEPWASFDRQSYSIFTDDFVHEKLLTVKVNQKPSKATINLKEQVAKKGDNYKSSGEIKLWFPIWNSRNGALYFRSRSEGLKIHYDDGLKSANNSIFDYFNLYASYQSHKNFKNAVIKAGGNIIAKSWSLDNRVRVDVPEVGQIDVSIGHKFSWAKNNWSYDVFKIFSLKQQALLHNAIRIGYRKGDNDFFFRAENGDTRPLKKVNYTNLDTYFTRFIFDYVTKVNDLTKVGVETEFTKKSISRSSIVLQRSFTGRQIGIKAKVSSDKSIALSYQAVINNIGKYTLGAEISDLGNTNKPRYGVQLEVNL